MIIKLTIKPFLKMKTIFLLCFILSIFTSIYAKDEMTEEEIKAGYLLQIPKFVEKGFIFEEKNPYFTIVLLGDTIFKSKFTYVFKGQTIKGKAIEIIRCYTLEDLYKLSQINLAFIAKDLPENTMQQALLFFNKKKALTISSKKDFIIQGGIFEFIKLDNKIKFNINVSNAKKNKIKFSSFLLKFVKRK